MFIDNLDHKPTIHRISTNTPQKEFTSNISPQERGRNIIRSNYNSKARDTSRLYHLKNTRETDQTHSYWYIPSAPRVNYSLLLMESAGMMKMATGEGFPSGRVPEQGPDWFLVATEACGEGTSDLFYFLKVLGYMGIYRRKKSVRGATRGPRGWRARPCLMLSSLIP